FIAYYEKDWGSVRFAWNKQTSYNRTEAHYTAVQQMSDGLLDMTANYNVSDSIRITCGVTNRTDETGERYRFLKPGSGLSTIPRAYVATGRTMTFGVNIKF